MKKYFAMAIVSVLFWIGCVTMPEPVDETLLVEKTESEVAQIHKFENEIIAKNKECTKAKKSLEAADKKIQVSKERLAILEDEKQVLLKKEKIAQLEENTKKVYEIGVELEKNEKKVVKQKAKHGYVHALWDKKIAVKEVKEAELSALIANMNYYKSRIAAAYLKNQEKKYGKKTEGNIFQKKDESYDLKYKKYLDQQKKQQSNSS